MVESDMEEMEEMGQSSADGVDIPRQNSVVVLVRRAYESPSRMGELDDVGVVGHCGVE